MLLLLADALSTMARARISPSPRSSPSKPSETFSKSTWKDGDASTGFRSYRALITRRSSIATSVLFESERQRSFVQSAVPYSKPRILKFRVCAFGQYATTAVHRTTASTVHTYSCTLRQRLIQADSGFALVPHSACFQTTPLCPHMISTIIDLRTLPAYVANNIGGHVSPSTAVEGWQYRAAMFVLAHDESRPMMNRDIR